MTLGGENNTRTLTLEMTRSFSNEMIQVMKKRTLQRLTVIQTAFETRRCGARPVSADEVIRSECGEERKKVNSGGDAYEGNLFRGINDGPMGQSSAHLGDGRVGVAGRCCGM